VSVTAVGGAMPTEVIESKEISCGFVALRLADETGRKTSGNE